MLLNIFHKEHQSYWLLFILSCFWSFLIYELLCRERHKSIWAWKDMMWVNNDWEKWLFWVNKSFNTLFNLFFIWTVSSCLLSVHQCVSQVYYALIVIMSAQNHLSLRDFFSLIMFLFVIASLSYTLWDYREFTLKVIWFLSTFICIQPGCMYYPR